MSEPTSAHDGPPSNSGGPASHAGGESSNAGTPASAAAGVRTRLARRVWLSTTAAGLTAGVLGCRGEETDDSPTAEERVDIPLRVTWVGEEAEFDVVRRAWGGVSPLPLEMTAIGLTRNGTTELDRQIEESASRTDVLIYPLIAQAGLFASERLTPWMTDSDGDDRSLVDRIPTALRNAAATYAGVVTAVPLGTRQPAWVTVDGDDPPQTWADYDAWVEGVDGAAAEPLTPGWAAAMFLLRAATSLDRGWLFERSGMEPTVATDPYVAVLEQMRQTASRYSVGRASPAELWSGIGRGEIRGGIGFPAGEQRSIGAVRFHDPPTELAVPRVLLDPFTPVGSVAASCRQTAAARRFLRWLAGGPGSESIRFEIARLTMPPLKTSGRRTRGDVRGDRAAQRGDADRPEGDAGGNASVPVSTDPYQGWLAAHLGEAVTAPTLRLLNGSEYYAALDEQVGRCLDGDATPDQALSRVADRWRQITEAVGSEPQERAWQRAQGLLG